FLALAAVSPAARAGARYWPQAPMVTTMTDLLPNAPTPSSPLARRTAVVACWLCGIRLHQNQMVPDGGDACPDLRWYCKDIQACTGRWSSAQTAKLSADDPPNHSASRLAPTWQSADRAAGPGDGHQAGAGDPQAAGTAQKPPG